MFKISRICCFLLAIMTSLYNFIIVKLVFSKNQFSTNLSTRGLRKEVKEIKAELSQMRSEWQVSAQRRKSVDGLTLDSS